MHNDLYKPGMDNRPAGKYKEVGPRGGKVGNHARSRLMREIVSRPLRRRVIDGKSSKA